MTPDDFHDKWPLTGGHEGCCAFWQVAAAATCLAEILADASAAGFTITVCTDGAYLIEE